MALGIDTADADSVATTCRLLDPRTGPTEFGSRAAASHTNAMAGNAAVWGAAARALDCMEWYGAYRLAHKVEERWRST